MTLHNLNNKSEGSTYGTIVQFIVSSTNSNVCLFVVCVKLEEEECFNQRLGENQQIGSSEC